MKLRTSFFNPTVFKKDLTRFAPTWALYTVGLFMMLAVCMDATYQYRQAQNLADTIGIMSVINLGYGLLNAQLLFGDLFSAKHCNALHAMPLRRECWYVTHTVSGLLFSLAPNALFTLVAAILGTGWSVAFWWLLAVTLQYLFFFGLAVLSALCVGNRFAMVLVYGIVNFLSLIVYWFYYSIYEPLLYGVYCDQEVFTRFCPAWNLTELAYDMLVINRNTENHVVRTVELGEGWGYYAICAAIGVALLGLALVLYRRRKLESAGDFMAVRPLEPVFLGLYTLSMAAFFHAFADLFNTVQYVFLGLGIIVGFFTGRMLLKRTIRVFQPRALLVCFLCGVVFATSMVLTAIDLLGVTRNVPRAEQVEKVYVTPNRFNYNYSGDFAMKTPEDVEKVLQLHETILAGKPTDLDDDYFSVCVSYVLKNGKTVQRYYPDVQVGGDAWAQARVFFTRTEYILNGKPEAVMAGLADVTVSIYESSENGDGYYGNIPADMGRDLMQAIIADCNAGKLVQHWAFAEDYDSIGWVEFIWVDENGREYYNSVDLYQSADCTAAFLKETVQPWLEVNGY